MAANDFDPAEDDELQQKAKGIIIRPTVPIPAPRPFVAPPLEPGPTGSESFAARYSPLEHPRSLYGESFDPSLSQVRAEKHFDLNEKALQDVEDRRQEQGMETADNQILPASSLQEWGYRQHPGMRPQSEVRTPWTTDPSTPMAKAMGREDIPNIKPGSEVGNFPVGRDTEEQFRAATKALNLTNQERELYRRHLTNLWGPGGVDHPDGSRSTLYQTSMGVGNKTYNIPTVWGGKIVDPREAFANAKAEGLDKFPSYNSPEEAEARYQRMHDFMERDMQQYRKLGAPWSK